MEFIINRGTGAYTAKDRKVGSVDLVVIDPVTRQVEYIVVRKGWLLPHDTLIPIQAVLSATAERINLDPAITFEDLPPFEEGHFVPAAPDPTGDTAPPVVYYGPFNTPTPVLEAGMRLVHERNVPDRLLAVQTGSSVIVEGDSVGAFDRLITTSEGLATHLVVRSSLDGLLRAVPIGWVESLSEHEIRVGCTTWMFDRIDVLEPSHE